MRPLSVPAVSQGKFQAKHLSHFHGGSCLIHPKVARKMNSEKETKEKITLVLLPVSKPTCTKWLSGTSTAVFLRNSLICEMKICINATNISYVCHHDLFHFAVQAVDTPRIKYPTNNTFFMKNKSMWKGISYSFYSYRHKDISFHIVKVSNPTCFSFSRENF